MPYIIKWIFLLKSLYFLLIFMIYSHSEIIVEDRDITNNT